MTLDSIWVYAEAIDGTVDSTTLELLTKARELADSVSAVIAGDADGRVGHRFGEEFTASQAESADEVLVVVDVAVQGGLTNAELLGDLGQGDRVETVPVGQFGRGIQYTALIERFARCRHVSETVSRRR